MKRRRRIRPIHLAPLLALLALTAWVFASPVGSSPDDDFHLASIWCAGEESSSLCSPGPTEAERVVPPALVQASCYKGEPTTSAACQDDIATFDSEASLITGRGNFAGGYPPLYYLTMNAFVGPDVVTSALVLRMINVVLFVGLTTAVFALLPHSRRPALAWGWIVTTVPLGLFLIASNNPSAWAIVGVGTLWIALLGFLETRGRRQVGLGAVFVVATLMAAGSRGDSAMYAMLAIAAVLFLAFTPTKRFLIASALPAVMVIASILFFLSSRQVASGVTGFASGSAGASLGPAALALDNFLNIPTLLAGVFGTYGFGLGWLDTQLPSIVAFAAIVACVSVLFVGLFDRPIRKVLVLAGSIVVVWLLPVYVLTQGNDPVGDQVQPRYLLPLLTVIAGVALLRSERSAIRFNTLQRWLIVGLLSAANAVSLHTNMRRYITGVDSHGLNLDNFGEWWWDMPFSPMFVFVVGSLAYAGVVAIVVREIAGPAIEPGSVTAQPATPTLTDR